MKSRSIIMGLAFDHEDGHVRITKGDNFRLMGGSERTHEFMQEKAMDFNGELQKKGKNLDQISPEEFYEIADKIGIT
ncbi:MAG: hypothetical protein Q8Q33_00805 [Chlamydiota bacterium]|nr:hypothetical protein [Chlamydiota bacterium]